jgi:hypothetical protein
MATFGWNVFSPITHSHPLHTLAGMQGDWKFWEKIDTEYLECSNSIVIFRLPGWEDSVGVTAEIKIAHRLKLDIYFLDLYDLSNELSPYVLSPASAGAINPERFNHRHQPQGFGGDDQAADCVNSGPCAGSHCDGDEERSEEVFKIQLEKPEGSGPNLH